MCNSPEKEASSDAQGSGDLPAMTSNPGEAGKPSSSAVNGVKPENEQLAEGSPQSVPNENEKQNRPEWETAETLEDYWKTRKTFFTDDERTRAWEETAKIVEKYSDEMVERWNKEIDVLLVFAGLFSAIQTAFNVELYKRLIPTANPDPDPVLVALERISAQLGGFAMNQAHLNSTQPPFVLRDSTPTTPAIPLWVVVLNALWFASLISSLATASIGIMVKQWLTEYKFGVSGTSRQSARLRQLRLNSLERWHVKEIVSFLPVLLQIASGLFFAGLLILLWNLNRTVATVGTILVGTLVVFSLTTIVLPIFATHCAYLSPPSRTLYELARLWRKALYSFRIRLCSRILHQYSVDVSCPTPWEREQLQREHPWMYHAWKLLYTDNISATLKWRGMEGALISRRSEHLDGDIVAKAYITTMDVNYLHHAAVCTTEVTPSVTRTVFEAIRTANVAHWGEREHRLQMRSVHPFMWSGIVISLLMGFGAGLPWSPSDWAARLWTAYDYLCRHSPPSRSDTSRTRLLCVDFARIIRHYDPDAQPRGSPDIADTLLEDLLPHVMARTAELRLGNDVRQYVAYTCAGKALKVDWTDIDESETARALDALRCIIHCVPLAGSPDCTPDDYEFEALRTHADRALGAFAEFLVTPRASERYVVLAAIDEVFRALLTDDRGERAGILSPSLIQPIVGYLETYEIDNGEPAYSWWDMYLEKFIRKLADSSGQIHATAIVASKLRRMERHLSVLDAASLTGDYDDIQQYLHALRHIVRYIPPIESSDSMLNDLAYEAAGERSRRALRTFSDFLSTSETWKWAEWIDDVFSELRCHGEQAGLLSPELTNVIINYRNAYEGARQDSLPWWWDRNKQWTQKLMRDLAKSERHATANVTSTSAGFENPLPVRLAEAADDFAVNVSSPEPSQPEYNPFAVVDTEADLEKGAELITDRSSAASDRPPTYVPRYTVSNRLTNPCVHTGNWL